MACAAITSFMSTISMALGNQSLNLKGDVKELMEVLHGKLDSLRTLVEEIDKIIRDREALKTLEAQTAKVSYCAEDMVESEMREQFTYSAEDIVELDLGELARLEIEESHRITNAAITSFLEEIEEESQPRIYVAISSFLEKVEESQRRTNAAITSYLEKIEESQPRSSIAITSFLAEIKESQRRTEFAISSYLDEVEASQQRTNAAIASFVAEFQESQQKSIASLVAEVEESQPRTVESFLAKVEESQPGTISSYMARVEESQRRTNAAKASFLAKIEVSQGGANAAITYFLATQSLSKKEQTTKVAYTAAKMESGLKELALPGIEASQGRNFCECLQQVIENLDSTAEEWMKMKNMYGNINDLKTQTFDLADTSQHVYLESKNIMVGYDNELEMMQDQLVRGLRELKVISLVGMGGICKTTFATRIFNEPLIISHFDVRAKITVSQEYHLRNIFLGLLHYTSSRSERFDGKNDGDLADLLQKSLKGRRYLVIVDDIWTTEAWDEIRMCFPFQNNGSRILLTTRNTEVAEYASFDMPPYQMRLLSFDECWSLLYQKVFLNGCLTPELEKIGKEIARKCQGLPLATVVMAGVLLKIGNSLDEWTKVAEDVNLLMSTDLNHYCSRVLALSYYHLPHHLKACLLYFVVFKKSSDIPVIKLVRLWAAEGFVKVKRDESFIMVGDKCLKDLIDRSLVFVNAWSFYGKIKSCGIHDMIYGFCSQEAQNINFLNIKENDVHHRGSQSTVLFPSDSRRISIQSSGMNYQSPFGDDTDTKVHSILCYGERFSTKELELSCFKLLRVLDVI